MKRDMDLVRKILLELEEYEHGIYDKHVKIEGYSDEQVKFHCYLIWKFGLAEGADITHTHSQSREAHVSCLTMEGYDFLDAARDEGVWMEAKTRAQKVGGTVAIAVMIELLKDVALRKLGLKSDN